MSAPDVAIVVQARMSSRRLPGKVLAPLAGEPALARMLERLARVTRPHRLVVATSVEPDDDAVADLVASRGVAVARGPLDDVLARVRAAVPGGCDTVVRLTGDCPLVDPALVEQHLDVFDRERHRADYVTNALSRTHPDGLDVEVVSRSILERAHREATDAHDREHVLPWVARHGRVVHVRQRTDLSALRWTLDTPDDYAFIASVYDALYPDDPAFDSAAVYRLLAREPALVHVAHEALAVAADEWVSRIQSHLSTSGGRVESVQTDALE